MVRIIFIIFEYNHKNMDLEFLSIEFLNNSVKDYLYFFLAIIIGLTSTRALFSTPEWINASKTLLYESISSVYFPHMAIVTLYSGCL